MVNKERRLALESEEQQAVITWAIMSRGKWPELKMLYHVPNEGARSVTYAAQLKRMGMRRGVPDLCLPVARGGFHGLYIELKRYAGSRVTPEQQEWIEDLAAQGFRAVICYGADEAIAEIKRYLGGDHT
jgi:hypothetical protein